MKKYLLLFSFCCFIIKCPFGQTKPPFWDDVQTNKQYDRLFRVPAHPILFVGSSSIRKWDDLQQVFGPSNVLNRGIGGAVINDIIFYLNDLVIAYQPRQIVLYVGENDLVNETETVDTIFNRTVRLYRAIRVKMPYVPVVYLSIKPSPVRERYLKKAIEVNNLIASFISKQQNIVFVDVFSPLLKDGRPRPELFVSDMLHMNQQGYDIWDKIVAPYLLPVVK